MPLEPWYAIRGELVAKGAKVPFPSTFVLGETMPDAVGAYTPQAKVGPRVPETSMSNYDGTITNAGSTPLDRLIITGRFDPNDSVATLRDCKVLGGMPPGYTPDRVNNPYPLWDVRASTNTDITIEYSEIAPSVYNHEIYGFKGGNAHLYRSVIRGTVDGIQAHGSGAYPSNTMKSLIIEGCLIEDLRVHAEPAGNQSDLITHNDGLQATGALTLLKVYGTAIYGGRTSCILIQQSTGLYGDIEIEKNWLIGHPTLGSTFNTSQNGRGAICASGHFWVRNNRMSNTGHLVGSGSNATRFPVSPSTKAAAGWSWTGNTYIEDGTTANVGNGAD